MIICFAILIDITIIIILYKKDIYYYKKVHMIISILIVLISNYSGFLVDEIGI